MKCPDGFNGSKMSFHTGSALQRIAALLLRSLRGGNSDALFTLNLARQRRSLSLVVRQSIYELNGQHRSSWGDRVATAHFPRVCGWWQPAAVYFPDPSDEVFCVAFARRCLSGGLNFSGDLG